MDLTDKTATALDAKKLTYTEPEPSPSDTPQLPIGTQTPQDGLNNVIFVDFVNKRRI